MTWDMMDDDPFFSRYQAPDDGTPKKATDVVCDTLYTLISYEGLDPSVGRGPPLLLRSPSAPVAFHALVIKLTM